VGVLNHSPR